MKILVTVLILASAVGSAIAQEPAAKAPVEAAKAYNEAIQTYNLNAKVIAELSAAQRNGQQKNSPFSAEEVNESVQTLADGNRIVRSSTGKFYRNSEGRVRREMNGGVGGMMGTTYSFGQGVSIVSPDQGSKYLLDTKLQTARLVEMAAQGLTIASSAGQAVSGDLRAKLAERQAIELKNNGHLYTTPAVPPVPAVAPLPSVAIAGLPVGGSGFAYTTGVLNAKYESRTDELGTRDFEGVSAEGTRKTTTIPAGAIGNERPIEIVYERWFSKELGLVVYSKNTDPRFGEQTYKLTNVVRAEPDPSLFSVPTHYRTVTEPGTFYKMSPPPTKTAKTSAPAAVKPVNVSMPAKAARP